MDYINFWKNITFNKNKEEFLNLFINSKIERSVIIEIKDNIINNVDKIKFHWKDKDVLTNLLLFINIILSKTKLFNCFFVFILSENDHQNIDIEFPFFSQQKFHNSKILLYPDYFYLQDYTKNGVRGVNNENIIKLNLENPFDAKLDNIMFRSSNRKYFFLQNNFDNSNTFFDIITRVKPETYLTHIQQHNYKYKLSLYERYDTIYLNLLENSIPFIIYPENIDDKYVRTTFYEYFIEPDKHFIKLKPNELSSLEQKINNYNFEIILSNKKNLMDLLKYDNIIDFYAKIFLSYSELFI